MDVSTRRLLISALLVTAALFAVVVKLYWLQVLDYSRYSTLSENNRIKIQPLPPNRGLIYDRNGVLLADNRPAYALTLLPETVKDPDAVIAELSQLIPISQTDLARYRRQLEIGRRFEDVTLRNELTEDERARLAVHLHRFPGVSIQARLVRHYPQAELAGHVLGYVGRIDEQDLERIDASNYAGTQTIGKSGLERSQESDLHGQVGYEEVVVDARGRALDHQPRQLPVAGRDLQLALDLTLQRTAMQALEGRRGAIVAMNPRDGGILALASAPGFDPNLFVGGISNQDYALLRDHPDRPLYNRAVLGQYPPGSTIKPMLGFVGLELGLVELDDTKYCGGYFQFPGGQRRYHCWKRRGHGEIDLKEAIIESCDTYFYELADDMGIDALGRGLAHFGFGEPTGIDLVGEKGGLLPSRAWKREARGEPWYPGETLIVGIGQGAFLTTPLQLAAVTAVMANKGRWVTPRLVLGTRAGLNGSMEGTMEWKPVSDRQVETRDPLHWQQMVDAMIGVIEDDKGTARAIQSADYRIAGKTGTAQVFGLEQDERYNADEIEERLRDHALFVGFAPAEDPRIVVAVIVENGGSGSSTAAPLAREIMDVYLLGADPTDGADPDLAAASNAEPQA